MRLLHFLNEEGRGQPATNVPPRLYHVTPLGDDILRSGFKSLAQLGRGAGTLGGAEQEGISFTTRENAQTYWEGMEVARRAAQGEYDIRDRAMMSEIGAMAGYNVNDALSAFDRVAQEHARRGPEAVLFNYLQVLAMGGKFPVMMGTRFPDALKTAKKISILEIDSRGPQSIRFLPSESEYKVYDPENFDYSTLREISP